MIPQTFTVRPRPTSKMARKHLCRYQSYLLLAGRAWKDGGNYKQRPAAAKPATCHTHSMHRRRSASYFGICDIIDTIFLYTTTPAPTSLFSTGRMPFLPPNQQRQSTGGICDSRPAISVFMPNSRTVYLHALERRNNRRNRPYGNIDPVFKFGGFCAGSPPLSADQGQIWHARQSPRYHLSCQILQ